MQKHFLLLFFSFLSIYLAKAQAGSISGRIFSSDNKPASSINISLKGENNTAVSDNAGFFHLYNIAPGKHIIMARFVGLRNIEEEITVEQGLETTVSLYFKEKENQLEEVRLSGSWNKFSQRRSDYVAKMPVKPLENPQVYNTVTKELAKEQLAPDFRSVLKNAPGVAGASTTNAALGRSQLMIRGFSQIFTLKNGMYVNSNFAPDPITIEKLDIVKGPSATLYGAAGFGMSYGGFVNQQTKRPYDKFGGEISYTGGTYRLSRLTADINIPLDSAKAALFRFTGAITTNGDFHNYGFDKSYIANPALSYKVNDRLTIRTELSMQHNIRGGYTYINPVSPKVSAKNWKDVKLDYFSSYGSDNIVSTIDYRDIYMNVDYKLSEKWRSQTNLNINQFDTTLKLFSVDLLDDSKLVRSGSGRLDMTTLTTNIQQNFIGDFKIGKMRNRLLLGADYTGTRELKQSLYGKTFIIDTVNYLQKQEQIVSSFDFDKKVSEAGFTNYGGKLSVNVLGLYAVDVLNITDKLLVTAGIRFNSYHDSTGVDIVGSGNYPDNKQSNFAPKFGIIYQPIKDRLSIFANYQNGFTNNFSKDYEGNQFKPEHANQWETGIKMELAQGLTGSVSYYDIKVQDKLRSDVAHPGFSIQDATQYSKGLEADLIYNPILGLNLLAGYGHNNSKYVRTNPSIEGKIPANVPQDLFNFWGSYKTAKFTRVGEIGIGLGANYTSTAYTNDANTFKIPAYTIFDGTVFYEQKKYRVGLKVNNIGNTKSWNRWGSQPLRQFVGTISYKF